MPVTRSQKNSSTSRTATGGTTDTSDATTGSATTETTGTTGTTTTTESTLPKTPPGNEVVAAAPLRPTPPRGPPASHAPAGSNASPTPLRAATRRSVARSTAVSKRRLMRAREELLQKEVELARARVAMLEAESSEDESNYSEAEDTVKNQQTTEWVRNSMLALADTPFLPPPSAEENVRPEGPLPCPDASLPPPHTHAMTHSEEQVTLPQLQPPPPLSQLQVPPTPQQFQPLPPPALRPHVHTDLSELAAAITLASRTTAHPRTMELAPFNGASSDWLPFKAAYEETASHLTEQENLSRLRRCLRGAAKEAVQCLFIGVTTPAAVMKMLQTRFGRPDALVAVELNRLRALPKLQENPRDICIFASRVLNATSTIQALGKPHYLYNAEVVRSIVEKLPSALRYKYYDYNAEQPEGRPDLLTLSHFLSTAAERCGTFAPAEIIAPEDRREPPTKKIVRTYVADDTPPPKKRTPQCRLCEADHKPADCSEMKKATVSERWELAKKHRLCFRCLCTKKMRHACKSNQCNINGCIYRHHRLLHQDKPEAQLHYCEETPTTFVASTQASTSAALKIIPVQVSGPNGSVDTYALMDDGSTCTIINAATAKNIGATGQAEPFYIEGVAGMKIENQQSRRVNFTIKGRDQERSFDISARTMEDLHLSPQTVSRQLIAECGHLRDLEEQLVYDKGLPTILLGQDNFHLLFSVVTRFGGRNQPVASLTELGWVLHGHVPRHALIHRVNHVVISAPEEESMEALMKEHFALESLGVEPRNSVTPDESRALSILKKTTQHTPDGRYESGLLWKHDDFTPPESYGTAYRRLLMIEKKLDKDKDLKKRYETQMAAFLSSDFAEEAPTTRSTRTWYLPHFAVINPQKPGKLRIVHDAAAKSSGVSLNDLLLSGPDLLQSLPGILIRFRQRPIAVTGDIKDMFLRISIREEDRDMQRFLWRGSRREGQPTEYRMKSVIFGAKSSPCTAIFVKNTNAERHAEEHPKAVNAILRNHYMDDYLASFNTETEALEISTEVARIHREGSFHLQKWASNSALVRHKLEPESNKNIVELAPEKILGMIWDTQADTLGFNTNLTRVPAAIIRGERTPTKREALRVVMSIYDPLGLATPVTVQAKRILQDTWRSGTGWDEELPPREAEAWNIWANNIQRMGQLSIPRCHPYLARELAAEMHIFVDASSTAYAAAVYWRITDEEGISRVSLIIAKGRVAPLKTISIPRLELQAAVLGCRLARTAVEEHDIKPARRVFWSDSSTVLTWLRTGPRSYKPFVAHRVAEISESTRTNEWRWVPTKLNVADDATRMMPHDFDSNHRWFVGPDFLRQPEEDWPQQEFTDKMETGEERVNVATTPPRFAEALPDVARFSSWLRLMRSTARILQFIALLRTKREQSLATRKRTKKSEGVDPNWKANTPRLAKKVDVVARRKPQLEVILLPAEYMQRAELLWVKAIQHQDFETEIAALRKGSPIANDSRLKHLSMQLGKDGILRLKSRIAAAEGITATQSEPAILDGGHPWARLFITYVHTQLHHGGFETTANEVRQQYWMLRLRVSVRTTVKRCQPCRLRKAKPAWPSTGNHPPCRLAHHRRAFTYTGLDYFGPMAVTVGRGQQKRYGALFTCLTTRAVHLELAGSLSTDSAIMALRRFISRRGCPTELWSDNGTNLRGADSELKRMAKGAMAEEASVRSIKWRYIPPGAPFMGGAWERMVRSVKTALQTTLREKAPHEEVLMTLLIEAEHTINSRPLTHVSMSPGDDEPLTPNHFLMGGPSRVPLPGAFVEGDDISRKSWIASQRLADVFWARWVREYLPELQHRREPHAQGSIKVGDLVLIADGTLPRNIWPKGQVVATFPGPDGEIRAVDVRTVRGILRRPTKKLIILPVSREPQELQLGKTAAGEDVRDII